jgi:hypothetical protein
MLHFIVIIARIQIGRAVWPVKFLVLCFLGFLHQLFSPHKTSLVSSEHLHAQHPCSFPKSDICIGFSGSISYITPVESSCAQEMFSITISLKEFHLLVS